MPSKPIRVMFSIVNSPTYTVPIETGLRGGGGAASYLLSANCLLLQNGPKIFRCVSISLKEQIQTQKGLIV